MKHMRILGIVILSISFFQCKSLSLNTNPPFTIDSASFTHNIGGIPGVSSTTVEIAYSAAKTVDFESIYFQGRDTKVNLEKREDKTFIKGYFNTSSVVGRKQDLILHKDPKKEMGNTLPKKKFPFDLKENEAVISYKEGDTLKYYKIENIKQGKTKTYR